MIRLYFSVASRCFVPLWLLEELGVPYETVDTDFRAGKHKAAGYLAINPLGKVPVLGGVFAIAFFNKRIDHRPAFAAYNARLSGRAAFQRAAERNRRPELFKR